MFDESGPTSGPRGRPTAGMIREEAVTTDGMWAGFVRTAPNMTSGWHHHGLFATLIYVDTGALVNVDGPED